MTLGTAVFHLASNAPLRILAGIVVRAALVSSGLEAAAASVELEPRTRRPVAIVATADGRQLLTANEGSGSISVIDLAEERVVREVDVGRRLVDIVRLPGAGELLAVDEAANELLLLARSKGRLDVRERLKVSAYPVSVVVVAGGRGCSVASLWARRLTIVHRSPTTRPGLRVAHTVSLPFAPRRQVAVRGGTKVIVADSFGGRLAVVDVDAGRLEHVRTLAAHNIRGLAESADGKSLLVAHQILDENATTTFENVAQGKVITNNLRRLSVAGILDRDAGGMQGGELLALGRVGRGAGDPAAVAVSPGGQVVVALAGVGEVAVASDASSSFRRSSVGARPTAVAVHAESARAYVANTFSDSITTVDLETGGTRGEVLLGPRAEPTLAERGERLFYDAKRSKDGWMSCHSCHTDGHRNGLSSDTLGDGGYGAPKRILSLFGVVDSGPWSWRGRVGYLDAQLTSSIETTMHGEPLGPKEINPLNAFLRSLVPPPSVASLNDETRDAEAIERGRSLFHGRGRCTRCHEPPDYTTAGSFDVGLVDEVGKRRFNPPSLRGVSQRQSYFHDGRARSFEDVLRRFEHPSKRDWSDEEIADLVTFLRSL